MRTLILGGTQEARQLAEKGTGEAGFDVVSSLAGRVRAPILPPGRVRIGGFGGINGLRDWLSENAIEAVVDATHPFAHTISGHAAVAARRAGVPILHLRRPGWSEEPGDTWLRVPHMAAAACCTSEFDRVFLTIGRQQVAAFADQTASWFLIRAIDPPTGPVPARHHLLLSRGPFTVADELVLLSDHRIDVLVTKDSGGEMAAAKLVAARQYGIPVVMIDRTPLPDGATVVETVAAAWDWLHCV